MTTPVGAVQFALAGIGVGVAVAVAVGVAVAVAVGVAVTVGVGAAVAVGVGVAVAVAVGVGVTSGDGGLSSARMPRSAPSLAVLSPGEPATSAYPSHVVGFEPPAKTGVPTIELVPFALEAVVNRLCVTVHGLHFEVGDSTVPDITMLSRTTLLVPAGLPVLASM